jgi:hypothetical protein
VWVGGGWRCGRGGGVEVGLVAWLSQKSGGVGGGDDAGGACFLAAGGAAVGGLSCATLGRLRPCRVQVFMQVLVGSVTVLACAVGQAHVELGGWPAAASAAGTHPAAPRSSLPGVRPKRHDDTRPRRLHHHDPISAIPTRTWVVWD